MKKILPLSLFGLLFLFITMDSKAQDSAYQKGQFQINAGVDFGVFSYDYRNTSAYSNVSTSNTIPISANIEYGIHEHISLGGYAGYYGKTWTYDNYSGETSESSIDAIAIGTRGTLHGTPLINELIPDANINAKHWDLYASLTLGVETISWDHSWEGDHRNDQPSSDTDFVLGPILGARYMFNPNFGAFLEFGRGTYGLGRIGVSFNL